LICRINFLFMCHNLIIGNILKYMHFFIKLNKFLFIFLFYLLNRLLFFSFKLVSCFNMISFNSFDPSLFHLRMLSNSFNVLTYVWFHLMNNLRFWFYEFCMLVNKSFNILSEILFNFSFLFTFMVLICHYFIFKTLNFAVN